MWDGDSNEGSLAGNQCVCGRACVCLKYATNVQQVKGARRVDIVGQQHQREQFHLHDRSLGASSAQVFSLKYFQLTNSR